jgi:prepilin-type N-terminal cleavage/methylation domain-containing protein
MTLPRLRTPAPGTVSPITPTVPPPQKSAKGFSLLELLVVLALIGILAATALPRFGSFRAAAYDTRAQQDLRNLATAEELHRAINEEYQAEVESLDGFRASQGVEITVERADEESFLATSSHPSGTRLYRWDSEADPALTAGEP